MYCLARCLVAVMLSTIFCSTCIESAYALSRVSAHTQPTFFQMFQVAKKKAKKASTVSCPDLYAKAEDRCGSRITCNKNDSCQEMLCTSRWTQCGFKPKCSC